MRSPSPRVTYSYSDPAVRTSLAYLDTIQPIAKTPIPAISTDSGDAMPPPLPVTLATPTTSGITKAEVNTGPINPTDCAITSGNDNTLAPRRPLSGWGFSMSSTISFLSSLRGVVRVFGKLHNAASRVACFLLAESDKFPSG